MDIRHLIDFLACPICKGSLRFLKINTRDEESLSGLLTCLVCGRRYRVRNGVYDFLLPEMLNTADKLIMEFYDQNTLKYDILISHIAPFLSLGLEHFNRYMWVRELKLRRSYWVPDVATGTGRNIPYLLHRVGSEGLVIGLDISMGALTIARRKYGYRGNVVFVRCNASYLPFKDRVFDGVISVGGINTFGEKEKAISEMIRVAKKEAQIVVVDEGLSPKKLRGFIGRFLLRTNTLYATPPPISLFTKHAEIKKFKYGILLFFPYYMVIVQNSKQDL